MKIVKKQHQLLKLMLLLLNTPVCIEIFDLLDVDYIRQKYEFRLCTTCVLLWACSIMGIGLMGNFKQYQIKYYWLMMLNPFFWFYFSLISDDRYYVFPIFACIVCYVWLVKQLDDIFFLSI